MPPDPLWEAGEGESPPAGLPGQQALLHISYPQLEARVGEARARKPRPGAELVNSWRGLGHLHPPHIHL